VSSPSRGWRNPIWYFGKRRLGAKKGVYYPLRKEEGVIRRFWRVLFPGGITLRGIPLCPELLPGISLLTH